MTPDAFLDDWYAWATNQLSHALIGLALTGVLAVILRAVAGQERRAVALAIVAAVYFVGWESAWQAFGAMVQSPLKGEPWKIARLFGGDGRTPAQVTAAQALDMLA